MSVQKGKPNNPSIQPGPYQNQQGRSSNHYNVHYDGDATATEYQFGGSPYVGGTGGPVPGAVQPRLPLTVSLSGPNPQGPPIATPPTGPNPSVGGMPQGPPPGAFIAHLPVEISKQTPPIHQPTHHSIQPGGISVAPQQLPMANAGHSGQLQGRATQGNNQPYFRTPMRAGNPHIPRQMAPSITPSHPPNTPPMPYPNPTSAINQPVVLFMAEGYNNPPMIPYLTSSTYYQPPTMNPTGVSFNPTRPPQPQQQQLYRNPTYQYQMSGSAPVYYPQQQQQPQLNPTTAVTGGAPASQSREACVGRRQRSYAIPIVDPNTYCDILSGEKVPPSDTAASTTVAPTEPPPLIAEKETTTTPTSTATVDSSCEVESKAEDTVVEVAVELVDVEKPVLAPVEATLDKEPTSVARENGDLPSSSEPPSSSASPTPVSTPTSPETGEGRGTQKRKGKKGSRAGSTSTSEVAPVSSETTEEPTRPSSQNATSRDTSNERRTSVTVTKETLSEPEKTEMVQTEIIPESQAVTSEPSIPNEPAEQAAEISISNGDQQESSSTAPASEAVTTSPSVPNDEGEMQSSSKPSLRYSYKEDQWSPVNPEGKKAYDRNFLLELKDNPASLRKPEGLPNLEVVRDKNSASKRPDFTPNYLKMSISKGVTKRSSQQGNRGDQGASQQPRREIKFISSMTRNERVEDINVWKPKHAIKSKEDDPEKAKTEELLKTVRGILNKLTPQKFEKLLNKIHALNIDTEDRLSGVIKLFFEKAVDEPIFSSTYAKMCQSMANKEVASSANPNEMTNFRKLLLTRCQKEFEKDGAGITDVENRKKELEKAETEEKRKELEEELENLINKNRRRSLGNIRFIGELFKLRILSGKIMHQCITRLLGQQDDEESLECLCRLLSTIGKELENPPQPSGARPGGQTQNREVMNSYFNQLEHIVSGRKTSNRIRFMIQDVIDLRKNQWVPRREDNNPKTIDQIHKEVEREREEQEKELMSAPAFQGPMTSLGQPSRGPTDRRDRDDRERKRSRGGQSDDGWSTVGVGSGRNAKLDMKQLRIPRVTSESDHSMMLGPGGRGSGQAWGRGASGGMSQSASISGAETRPPNRYQLLEDDSTAHAGGGDSKPPFSGRSSLGGPPTGRQHQDFRTISGSTKSAMYPQKETERERALEAVRSQATGRSRSQQSSRESSVTRSVGRDAPQLVSLRETPKEIFLGKATVADEEIERKTQGLLGEHFINLNVNYILDELKNWLHPATVPKFINSAVSHVLEHDSTQRRTTGHLFKEMVKKKMVQTEHLQQGFDEVLTSAEDILIDIPKLWEYLAEVLAPVFTDNVVNLKFLGLLTSKIPSIGSSLVPAVLKELVKTQDKAAVERLWIMSNVQLSSLLPGVEDPVKFLTSHSLDFLLRSKMPIVEDCPQITPAIQNYKDFQLDLERFMGTGNKSVEDIAAWISLHFQEEITPAFIRALVTTVVESCIIGVGASSKLNGDSLRKIAVILEKYIDVNPERELQALYAVQTLVHNREHPKGLIHGIFECLCDTGVVSVEGFQFWANSEDPSERDGKAVALKSITPFITWLNEPDDDSETEAEG